MGHTNCGGGSFVPLFHRLNAAPEDNRHHFHVSQDIFATLNIGTCYEKLDLSEVYLQIKVEPECSEYLTTNTLRVLYQFTRHPFGEKRAPGILQNTMDYMIKSTDTHLDDMIVGRTEKNSKSELDVWLKALPITVFHLRPEMCEFFLKSIKYLDFIFDSKGHHPDPQWIRAILNIPSPTDVQTLLSLLGLIGYYSSFLPCLHEVRRLPNRLLQKDTAWH